MPIYEFRCLKCNQISELLFLSAEDQREIKCPQCGAEDLERVLSTTHYSMAPSPGAPKASSTTKTCAGGSCSTLEIPGLGD
ncbi:MAG: zinc ribbon domain-containing protein [Thermodesulfobacteriota bacterium]